MANAKKSEIKVTTVDVGVTLELTMAEAGALMSLLENGIDYDTVWNDVGMKSIYNALNSIGIYSTLMGSFTSQAVYKSD